MTRYCKRDGCGHDEVGHANIGGECLAMVPGPGRMVRCSCEAFVADLGNHERRCSCEHPPNRHDHKVGCTIDGCDCSWLGQHAKPPSIPPLALVKPELEPVRDRSEALARAAACRRTAPLTSVQTAPHDTEEGFLANLAGVAIGGEKPSDSNRSQEHVLVDPGMKIMVGGRAREMTELHAAANAIIVETNAEDLAAGAFAMRATIRTQANEIVRLRAELENRDRILEQIGQRAATKPVNVSVKITVDGDVAPGRVAAALREELERFQHGPTPAA